MILCGKTLLDIAANISNIFIGFCTLFLAYYVFVYQKQKDRNDAKLQWVKDLIINPRFEYINRFYNNIYLLKEKFRNSDLTEEDKIEILDVIKTEYYSFRDSFIVFFRFAEPNLHKKLSRNIETLIDNLTNSIDNDELKLNLENVYNANFNRYIDESYEMTIKELFSYNGAK